MANLITGMDWIDHGLIPRRDPSELAEEQGDRESPDEEVQVEECRDSEQDQGE